MLSYSVSNLERQMPDCLPEYLPRVRPRVKMQLIEELLLIPVSNSLVNHQTDYLNQFIEPRWRYMQQNKNTSGLKDFMKQKSKKYFPKTEQLIVRNQENNDQKQINTVNELTAQKLPNKVASPQQNQQVNQPVVEPPVSQVRKLIDLSKLKKKNKEQVVAKISHTIREESQHFSSVEEKQTEINDLIRGIVKKSDSSGTPVQILEISNHNQSQKEIQSVEQPMEQPMQSIQASQSMQPTQQIQEKSQTQQSQQSILPYQSRQQQKSVLCQSGPKEVVKQTVNWDSLQDLNQSIVSRAKLGQMPDVSQQAKEQCKASPRASPKASPKASLQQFEPYESSMQASVVNKQLQPVEQQNSEEIQQPKPDEVNNQQPTPNLNISAIRHEQQPPSEDSQIEIKQLMVQDVKQDIDKLFSKMSMNSNSVIASNQIFQDLNAQLNTSDLRREIDSLKNKITSDHLY